MKQTEITLDAALKIIDEFCPIKVTFNNIFLYNDYDDEVPRGIDADGELCYGEVQPPMKVIPERLHMYKNYVVTSIKIDIVQHHHSIVHLKGHYDAEAAQGGNNY